MYHWREVVDATSDLSDVFGGEPADDEDAEPTFDERLALGFLLLGNDESS